MTLTKPPHLMALFGAIDSALEALDNYSDIIDGDEGLPYPNRAMVAYMELSQAYEAFKRETFPPPEGDEIQ